MLTEFRFLKSTKMFANFKESKTLYCRSFISSKGYSLNIPCEVHEQMIESDKFSLLRQSPLFS